MENEKQPAPVPTTREPADAAWSMPTWEEGSDRRGERLTNVCRIEIVIRTCRPLAHVLGESNRIHRDRVAAACDVQADPLKRVAGLGQLVAADFNQGRLVVGRHLRDVRAGQV